MRLYTLYVGKWILWVPEKDVSSSYYFSKWRYGRGCVPSSQEQIYLSLRAADVRVTLPLSWVWTFRLGNGPTITSHDDRRLWAANPHVCRQEPPDKTHVASPTRPNKCLYLHRLQGARGSPALAHEYSDWATCCWWAVVTSISRAQGSHQLGTVNPPSSSIT